MKQEECNYGRIKALPKRLANVLGVSNNSFTVYFSLIVILQFTMQYFE